MKEGMVLLSCTDETYIIIIGEWGGGLASLAIVFHGYYCPVFFIFLPHVGFCVFEFGSLRKRGKGFGQQQQPYVVVCYEIL